MTNTRDDEGNYVEKKLEPCPDEIEVQGELYYTQELVLKIVRDQSLLIRLMGEYDSSNEEKYSRMLKNMILPVVERLRENMPLEFSSSRKELDSIEKLIK